MFVGVDADEGEEDGESGGPEEMLACVVSLCLTKARKKTEASATEQQKGPNRMQLTR